MTNSEKIAYKNLTAKLNSNIQKLEKANAKLEDIATKQCTALNHEIAKLKSRYCSCK